MKKLQLIAVCFVLAVAVPAPAMAGVHINAGIFLSPSVMVTAPLEVAVMPDAEVVYVLADADAPEDGPTGRNEKPQDQSLEKAKAAESEEKSEWKINVWPVQPPDNVKSLPQSNDANKYTPPDRF